MATHLAERKVVVLGATGYVGLEVVRILARHPRVGIHRLSAERDAGDLYTHAEPQVAVWGPEIELRRAADMTSDDFADCDAVFSALPHGLAASLAPRALAAGAHWIDLGGDFRLRDPGAYPVWYGFDHPHPELLAAAVYGQPEWFGRLPDAISPQVIACPGCYPTASILGLAPAARRGWLTGPVLIDAKSGVSGAGRRERHDLLFGEVAENTRAYNLAGRHRHIPEIEQALGHLADQTVRVTFTPHLVPMARGILATIYFQPAVAFEALQQAYGEDYAGAAFVRLRPAGESAATGHVRGSQFADIGLALDPRTGWAVVTVAIDNLVRGAAGQAVQMMNRLFGWPEGEGLDLWPMLP